MFYPLRQISSIKGCLTIDSLKTLASALLLSRIDYGNMTLVSLLKVATQSIQSIINTTARLITEVRKYDHINPVLKELHCLKFDERIEYKIALQMYKCLSNEGLAHLTRDLVLVASRPEKQRLRSAKSKDVVPNKHKLKSLGLRRFSVSGPSCGTTCLQLKIFKFNKIILSISEDLPVQLIIPSIIIIILFFLEIIYFYFHLFTYLILFLTFHICFYNETFLSGLETLRG